VTAREPSAPDAQEHRVAEAVRRHARARRAWEADTALRGLLADPGVRRLREELDREELRGGAEMDARLPHLKKRYDDAVRDGDMDVLARICPGKHGRWGRICLLGQGHEATEPHWGHTPDGVPVAWTGSAPDAL